VAAFRANGLPVWHTNKAGRVHSALVWPTPLGLWMPESGPLLDGGKTRYWSCHHVAVTQSSGELWPVWTRQLGLDWSNGKWARKAAQTGGPNGHLWGKTRTTRSLRTICRLQLGAKSIRHTHWSCARRVKNTVTCLRGAAQKFVTVFLADSVRLAMCDCVVRMCSHSAHCTLHIACIACCLLPIGDCSQSLWRNTH